MLTNLSTHAVTTTKRGHFDTKGFPHSWESTTVRADTTTKKNVTFMVSDDNPSFINDEIFAPKFPSQYYVSDITQPGTGVILQRPPSAINAPSVSLPVNIPDAKKRAYVFLIIAVITFVFIVLGYKSKLR